ncbi:solute carrier family 23 member 1 [Gadus macrocephalus]|uniref:solute carrier family 23 member 1 n=1 Tax=Gadus macrocephalus TaxID=80720 RepID=UPI0028CB9DEA|nr:solute carrier family 23 member 1 [Gadus macrocephalus]
MHLSTEHKIELGLTEQGTDNLAFAGPEVEDQLRSDSTGVSGTPPRGELEVEVQEEQQEEEVGKGQELVYSLNDRPPWYLCILLGFQHYILAFGGIIAVPLILAEPLCIGDNNTAKSDLISTIFFVSGLCTLLQTSIGTRLPILQGGTFSLITPTLAILALPKWQCPVAGTPTMDLGNTTTPLATEDPDQLWMTRLREIQGAILVSSLLQVVLGLTGLVGLVLRFIGPLAIAPTINLIGLSLFIEAGKKCGAHWGIAALTVGLIILFSQYLSKVNVPMITYKDKKWTIFQYPLFKLFSVSIACSHGSLPCVTPVLDLYLARKIQSLREELKLLQRQYKTAGEIERAGLADQRAILRKQLLTLRRAEFHRRRRKERARKRTAFLANRFKLTKQLLGQKRTGCLTCSKDVIDNHLKATVESKIFFSIVAKRLSDSLLSNKYIDTSVVEVALQKHHVPQKVKDLILDYYRKFSLRVSSGQMTSDSHQLEVGSRLVLQTTGILMILLGIFGKFGAVFITIPEPVIGGMFLVMFGMIAAVGISNLQYVDLNSSRNLLILGFSTFSGLVLPTWFNSNPGVIDTGVKELDQVILVLFTTHMFIGGFLGFVLDNTIPGSEKERGIKSWRKKVQENGQGHAVNQSCYDIPYCNAIFQRFKCFQYLPFLPSYREPRRKTSK